VKPGWVLGIILAGLVALRFALFNEYLTFGTDMGSYLMTRTWLIGQDVVGSNTPHFRPPLIGLLLLPFTTLWGDLNGGKVLSLLLSVLPAIPFYFLVKLYVRPWIAVLAALVLVINPQNALNASLNQITLPAMSLAIWGMYVIAKLQRGEGKPWHLIPPVFLLVGLNQTMSGLFAIMAATFFLCCPSRRLFKGLATAFGLSLVWLPFYFSTMPLANGLYLPGMAFGIIPRWTTLAFFLPVLILSLFFPKKLFPWVIVALVLAFLAQLIVPEETFINIFTRGMRFVSTFTILACAMGLDWLVEKYRISYKYIVAVALVLLSSANLLWFDTFRHWADHYWVISPDTLAAVEWLDNSPADAKVLTYPEALGWYVGGMVPRRWAGVDGEGTPLKAYAKTQEAFDASMGWDGAPTPALLKEENITYLVIDRSHWQTFDNDGTGWTNLDIMPWFKKEAQFGSVGIYRVEAE